MIFPSCQKNDRQLITQPQKQTVELRQIPVEEALATLTEFLQENKGDLRDTIWKAKGNRFGVHILWES